MSTTEDDNILESVTLTCLRCGHSWIRRKVTPPKNCPKCISPYWNKPRQRAKKSDKKEVAKDENRVHPSYLCCVAEKRYEKDKDNV